MSGYEGKRKYVELPKWDWMDTSMKIDEIIEFDEKEKIGLECEKMVSVKNICRRFFLSLLFEM
jgi:hypothetical protein